MTIATFRCIGPIFRRRESRMTSRFQLWQWRHGGRHNNVYLLTMSLTINNEETHRCVRELARLAGETMAEAADRAVVDRLASTHRGRRLSQRRLRLS